MNFLIFRDFVFRIFQNFSEFSEFKIDLVDFILVHVMWQHVERLIARLIATVDRHLKAQRGGGVRDVIILADESF